MYIKIYRCKMCGKEIEKDIMDNIKADVELLETGDIERHFCDNGDMGVAEFVGMKKLE